MKYICHIYKITGKAVDVRVRRVIVQLEVHRGRITTVIEVTANEHNAFAYLIPMKFILIF